MKSYVALETAICPVCGVTHDTGTLLMHRQLRDTLENPMPPNSFLPCETHQKQMDEGFILLVGIDEERSVIKDGKISVEDAYRTGGIAAVKDTVAEDLFPEVKDLKVPMMFVQDEVIEILDNLMKQSFKTH